MSDTVPDRHELKPILFTKSPLNCMNYYYHTKTRTFYGNHRDSYDWIKNPKIFWNIQYPKKTKIMMSANNEFGEQIISSKIVYDTPTSSCLLF